MPYELQLDMLPGGMAVQAAKEGERALVQVAGVATSEDGEILIRYLGFAGRILNQLEQGGQAAIACSQVDNFLAIIRRDKTATVYVNELHIISKFRIARAFEAGDPVSKNDVVDIEEARLGDVSIPDDAGVIVVMSHEWRKAVLFDFAPLGDDRPPHRHYDIWPTLGQLMARLMFQERFSISDDDWKKFFRASGFLLPGSTTQPLRRSWVMCAPAGA